MRVTYKGREVFFDEIDEPLFRARKWQFKKNGLGLCLHARRSVTEDPRRTSVYFHREIIGPPPGYMVDHANRNGLDNRRSNLRIVTALHNAWNSSPRKGQSGIPNAHFLPSRGKWRIQFQGLTQEEAIILSRAVRSILQEHRASLFSKRESV